MPKIYKITTLLVLVFAAALSVNCAYAVPNQKSLELNEKAVHAVNSQDFKTAEKLFKDSLTADSGNLTAAFNLSGMYLTNQKYLKAINLLKQYTEAYPQDSGLWTRLGDAYFANKDLKSAQSAYKKAIALDDSSIIATKRLATIASLNNDTKTTEKLLRKAHSLDSKDAETVSNLSSVLLVNQNPKEAVTYAKRAIQLAPTKENYITLGTAYEVLEDYKNALISFERARDLGENSDQLKKKIAGLKKVVS